jgi:sugar fermentation stimulation protein A
MRSFTSAQRYIHCLPGKGLATAGLELFQVNTAMNKMRCGLECDIMNRTQQEKRSDSIRWPQLSTGKLIKRYKRFLADVALESGEVVTAHCPNTGSMQGCSQPGRPVYLSYHDNPKRKLKYTWELIDMPTSLVGVNTLVPNRLVARSIIAGRIKELRGYADLRREVKVGDHSRIDLRLSGGDRRRCYIEIKNCTLVADGMARFPDAVTTRGQKHIRELQKLAASGNRCVMFYFIQRMDALAFKPADQIDQAYGKALRRAVQNGVEALVYDVHIDLDGIRIRNKLPCRL